MANTETIQVDNAWVWAQSDKSYRIIIDIPNKPQIKVWLPISLTQVDEDSRTIELPLWLYNKTIKPSI